MVVLEEGIGGGIGPCGALSLSLLSLGFLGRNKRVLPSCLWLLLAAVLVRVVWCRGGAMVVDGVAIGGELGGVGLLQRELGVGVCVRFR